jgi:CARDB
MKPISLALIAAAALTTLAASAQPQLPPIKPTIPNQPFVPPKNIPGLLGKPDLTVMSIKPRMLGAVPYVYVCVKNSGAVNAGAFNVQLMMGAPAPTGSPPISWITLVGDMRYSTGVPAGGYTCNDFLLPGNALPNCVKYSARADTGNEIAESNESNNGLDHLGACLGEPPIFASKPKLTLPGVPVIQPIPKPLPGPLPGPGPFPGPGPRP